MLQCILPTYGGIIEYLRLIVLQCILPTYGGIIECFKIVKFIHQQNRQFDGDRLIAQKNVIFSGMDCNK